MQQELDMLFNYQEEKEPFTMKPLNFVHNVGLMTILAVLGGGFLIYKIGLPDFGGDVHELLKGETNTSYNQWQRYCQPNLRQRFGNGFDQSTCRQKMDAFALAWVKANNLKEKTTTDTMTGPAKTDYDYEVDENADAVRSKYGNISTVQNSMH